jgi:hypothetical protein
MLSDVMLKGRMRLPKGKDEWRISNAEDWLRLLKGKDDRRILSAKDWLRSQIWKDDKTGRMIKSSVLPKGIKAIFLQKRTTFS